MKIEPPSLNSGSAFWTVNSVPRAFSEKAASKCSSVISARLLAWPTPALAHSTSMAPFSCLTVSNRRSRSSRSAESACTPVTFRPIRSTASSSASLCRPEMKTWAPSSTNDLAPASAIPLVAPVITATLPSSFPTITPFDWSFRCYVHRTECLTYRMIEGMQPMHTDQCQLRYAGPMTELEKGPRGLRRGRGARERILSAPRQLFRDQGINCTGMDQLCAAAAVSKRTLYQPFAGKDELIAEYLRRFDPDVLPEVFDRADLTPRERLLAPFDIHPPLCPFIGAAVEIQDPGHPARLLARDYKKSFAARLTETARESC